MTQDNIVIPLIILIASISSRFHKRHYICLPIYQWTDQREGQTTPMRAANNGIENASEMIGVYPMHNDSR